MHVTDAKEFKGLLAATFDAYSKPAPMEFAWSVWRISSIWRRSRRS